MHIEFLIEDRSGEKLLQALVPRLLGPQGQSHSWRIHSYRGIGHIPRGLGRGADPSKRILLARLPQLLRGYGRTPGIDAVVVIVDVDQRDCREFLSELKSVVTGRFPAQTTLFRLAIEEIEAWYFGDSVALLKAYPKARRQVLDGYLQDSICGTWELLADAIYPGGSAEIKKQGWPLAGALKSEWAEKIGPYLELDRNVSPSFRKLRDGVRRLVG